MVQNDDIHPGEADTRERESHYVRLRTVTVTSDLFSLCLYLCLSFILFFLFLCFLSMFRTILNAKNRTPKNLPPLPASVTHT